MAEDKKVPVQNFKPSSPKPGGVSSLAMKKLGRNLARAQNQKGKR